VARGTKLFQAPGSPLIQGRSRTARPWWQPYLVSVALGLLWPIASSVPLLYADATMEFEGVGELFLTAAALWFDGVAIIVPSVLVGAAIGVAVAGGWGMRYRWTAGTVGAIGAWYAALVLIGVFA